ncbi:MAG: hybrid sensor histidine kinase/response regulator [Simkaniaceae bacterium]|nr:hybrid sensor histidine kinase/response regulator [Simkaniaceae bacterium]
MENTSYNVLVIEDSVKDVGLVKGLLHISQDLYSVKNVETLDEGKEMIGSEEFDIIVLSLDLEHEQGLQSFKELTQFNNEIPIILVTNHYKPELAETLLEEGAADILVKDEVNGKQINRVIKYGIERHKITHELLESNEKLEKRNEEKSQYVALVSHELKAPVNNIKQSLFLLEEQKSDDEKDQLITVCKETVARIEKILEDLQGVAKFEEGAISIEPKETDMTPLVQEIVDSFDASFKDKGIELNFKHTKDNIQAKIDPDRMNQVITNLISNALKYTEKGKVDVSLNEEGETISLVVEDSGLGIEKEDMNSLFDRYTRFHEGQKGAGLGLSIAKEMIEQQHGTISVESEVGKGTKFICEFPKIVEAA